MTNTSTRPLSLEKPTPSTQSTAKSASSRLTVNKTKLAVCLLVVEANEVRKKKAGVDKLTSVFQQA